MSAARAVRAPDRERVRRRGSALRVLPGVARSPRAPFVVLVLMVLVLGLVGLLLLNTALQQGSFALAQLESETTALRDRAQVLSSQVAALESPSALSERAEELGMVPADGLEYLELDAPPAEEGEE